MPAIKLRYGAYSDFVPSKLLPAEVGVVQTGDPNTTDGVAIYICAKNGTVKRFTTADDLTDALTDLLDDTLSVQDKAAEAAAVGTAIQNLVDATLTQAGKAADAKVTGDRFSDVNDQLDGKVDIQQENEDVGKILVVGSDGKLDLSGVFSARVRTAFANIFQHVAYTDSDAEEYYDELIDALAGGEKYLVSISASYVSTGHTVYPWNTLDVLTPYLSVTAIYNDGTTQTVTDYTLSGTLDSATSIITVGYLYKTTQVTVDVIIDPDLMYYAPSGYVLDGTNATAIDTGIKLSDTDKTFTVLFDTTEEEILTRVRSLFLVSWTENVGGQNAGGAIQLMSSQSGDDFVKQYAAIYGSSLSIKTGSLSNTVHRYQGALVHTQGSSAFLATMYVDGVMQHEETRNQSTYVANSQNVLIGKRVGGGYNWKGTLNMMNIYSRALSLSEIKSLLGVA